MKNTAVDWAFNQLDEQVYKVDYDTRRISISISQVFEDMMTIKREAKEMEKEQMLNFYMWMRMNEKAEEYLDYTDDDMFEEYLKQEKDA